MFILGQNSFKDAPSRVHVTLNEGNTVLSWDVNDDFGVVVNPMQDVLRVNVIRRPNEPENMPDHKRYMRVLTMIPWDKVAAMEFEYAGPPPEEVMGDAEKEKELLREALEAIEVETDDELPEA